ncbi:ABC-type transport auxiliary lipoprotein family protein [Sphingomonas crusticola]|uniref:ABC-type transport auxiliary lipoprotein family protein n=1 Tax=Sphingomonas crusticola TaxID=1697973 RepID=UPI000E258F27|nr:ABC-type transport auxiliary lipoprotein family protein [Sphingomonas crusticola]
MKKPNLALLAVFAALPLSGCISFGAKPPPRLMSLTATTPLTAGPAITSADNRAVAVAPLSAIPQLATQRVLVTDGPTAVAYLKGGLWASQPTLLFRSLLAETITVRTGRVVPDPRLLAIQPDTRLSGQLSAFGLDGPGMAVVVTFDGTIAHSGGSSIQSRRFSARVPVASEQPDVVAGALNQAANQVAGEVADWIGR